MKKINMLALFTLSLIGSVTFASLEQNKVDFTCKGINENLNFELNFSTNTIAFSDISGFHSAEIINNTPIAMTVNFKKSSVHFEYNWYFTAEYTLKIKGPFENIYEKGSHIDVTLSGDDDDGAILNDEHYSCLVR